MTNKRNLTGWTEFLHHPSADEIAEVFWEMDAEEQACFFNKLAEVSDGRLPFQLQAITDDEALSKHGRYAMQLIGNYSEQLK